MCTYIKGIFIQMNNLTDEQAKALDDRQNEAIATLKRFNYAYTPAPVAPYPSSMTDIKKYVNITPIGTYAPNESNINPVSQYMMLLPDKQTPETCLANAAMLKSRTLTDTPLNNAPIVGTQKNITKNISSKKLIRDVIDSIKEETVTEKRKFKKNELRKGKTIKEQKTKVTIDGLHYRSTRYDSGYMGDNPNYFNQNPDKIDIDTTRIKIYTKDMKLPTDFSNLNNATTTNATSNGRDYSIRQDNGRHFFAVEWSGFFKPNMTGEWEFTTNSDDVSLLWVETDLVNFNNGAFTLENATVNNWGLHPMVRVSSDRMVNGYKMCDSCPIYKIQPLMMTKDRMYRIKIMFSENGGGYNMIVTARCKNGGSEISNFKGFFFSEVIQMLPKEVEYEYIEYDVPYEADVQVTRKVPVQDIVYKEGDLETKTVSMGDMFNPTYSCLLYTSPSPRD